MRRRDVAFFEKGLQLVGRKKRKAEDTMKIHLKGERRPGDKRGGSRENNRTGGGRGGGRGKGT